MMVSKVAKGGRKTKSFAWTDDSAFNTAAAATTT